MTVHSETSSVRPRAVPVARRSRPTLLDVAVEVLVEDPTASLAAVASAAGIGRTTLHKQYATREDLVRAVAHRAVDRAEDAIARATEDPGDDGGLRALVSELIPIGPHLSFLWRNPEFDHDHEIGVRWGGLDPSVLVIIRRAQDAGVLGTDVPDWWLVSMIYAVIYSAYETVAAGQLASRDAPDLALRTFSHGFGARP